jgi:hypothetical protein
MTRDQGSLQEHCLAQPGPKTSAPFVYEKNTSTYSVFSRHPDDSGREAGRLVRCFEPKLDASNQVTVRLLEQAS